MESINSNIEKKDKVREYSLLRVLLMLLVVLGHSTYLIIQTTYGGVHYIMNEPNNFIPMVDKIIAWTSSFHMPAFFMLSGAVYFLSEKKTINELVKKKFKRLIIPFVISGILFMIPIKIFTGFYKNIALPKLIIQFIIGFEGGHLWFLPALFIVSIIFYGIKKLIKDKAHVNILIVLFITYLLQTYHNYCISTNIFYISNALDNIFWYTLGYCFELWRRKCQLFIKTSNVLIMFVVSLIAAIVLIMHKNYGINNIHIMYVRIIINTFMIYCLINLIARTKFANLKIIDFLDKYSMYIYLFHDPLEYVVLYITFKYNLFLSSQIGTIVYFLLRTVGVICVSILIKMMLDKIKTFFNKHKDNIKQKEVLRISC